MLSTFFSLHFSNGRRERELQTATGNTCRTLFLLPKLTALKIIRTELSMLFI